MQNQFVLELTCRHHGVVLTEQDKKLFPLFPELIGKELEQYARKEYERIKRGI